MFGHVTTCRDRDGGTRTAGDGGFEGCGGDGMGAGCMWCLPCEDCDGIEPVDSEGCEG